MISASCIFCTVDESVFADTNVVVVLDSLVLAGGQIHCGMYQFACGPVGQNVQYIT